MPANREFSEGEVAIQAGYTGGARRNLRLTIHVCVFRNMPVHGHVRATSQNSNESMCPLGDRLRGAALGVTLRCRVIDVAQPAGVGLHRWDSSRASLDSLLRRPPSLTKVAGPVAQLILPENAKKSLVVRGRRGQEGVRKVIFATLITQLGGVYSGAGCGNPNRLFIRLYVFVEENYDANNASFICRCAVTC